MCSLLLLPDSLLFYWKDKVFLMTILGLTVPKVDIKKIFHETSDEKFLKITTLSYQCSADGRWQHPCMVFAVCQPTLWDHGGDKGSKDVPCCHYL